MKPIIPHTPPRAPSPEPEAVLRFGDIEIRLGLSYLHHLIVCQGWGDRMSNYRPADMVMADAMTQIEKTMWEEIDRQRAEVKP